MNDIEGLLLARIAVWEERAATAKRQYTALNALARAEGLREALAIVQGKAVIEPWDE